MYFHTSDNETDEPQRHGPRGGGRGGPRRGGPRGGRGFGRPGGWQQADLPPAEDAAAWFTGRLPSDWFLGEPEISIDREEIIVTGQLPPVKEEKPELIPTLMNGSAPTLLIAPVRLLVRVFRHGHQTSDTWLPHRIPVAVPPASPVRRRTIRSSA